MTRTGIRRFAKLLKDECGQSAVIFALGMTAFVGLAGTGVEAGHAYVAYQQLVASTNAAVMAGAQAMPNTTQASTNVTAYSSVSGGKNASSLLTNVAVTPTFLCLSQVTSSLNTPCETSTGGSGGYNAVQVKQTASVPSWFAGLFGIKTFNLSYTATASMRGGAASNWNIAIVLDGTASMANKDSGAQCSGTQESCALLGVQALLEDLYPCALGQTCSSSSSYVDDVALYVFPPAATPAYDYCSGGTSPSNITNGKYIVPTLSSSYTYQVIPYSNNYKTTDAATTLATSSNIVKATGYSGTSCAGIYPKGGAGTYYAQAIYQAQSDLVAQQTANKGSKNAMIILSDGDATATVTYTSKSDTAVSTSSDLQPSSTNSLNGVAYNNPNSYTYPSANGECGQAVVAAQAAANAGTMVYTIGYGAETSGCSSDAKYSATVTNDGTSWGPGDSPCQALAAMASAPINFYSDDGNGCKAAVPSNQAITSLTAIFRQIASSFSVPRLIPNSWATSS